MGGKWGWLQKSNMSNPCGDGTVLRLDFIKVNILVVIARYSLEMLPLGKLGKRYRKSLGVISHNCMSIYNYPQIKSLT